MRGDILGVERRRRWSDDDKLEIVLSVGVDGATVTQVAHRHDVTRQQIYACRHELKGKGLLSPLPEVTFLPVELNGLAECKVPPLSPHVEARRPCTVELHLTNGRCLRFDPTLDTTTLTQMIRAVAHRSPKRFTRNRWIHR